MPDYYDEPAISDHTMVFLEMNTPSTCGFIFGIFGGLGD